MSIASSSRESAVARWGRRCVSLPLYAVLCAVGWAGAPLWFALAGAFDAAFDRVRWPRVRMVAFFLSYLALEFFGVTAAFFVWLRDGRDATAFRDANAALQRAWTSRLFAAASTTLGFRVELDPASDSPVPAPFLLFVRHSSTADTLLAAHLVANPHRILLKYVLKRELLWDPCLDVVGQRLPNVFVDRSGSRSDSEIRAIAKLGEGLDAQTAALIYPEGTRFSPSKLADAQQRLRRKPELASWVDRFHAVLPPRTGGPLALLEAAPGVDVLVLEHAGFEPSAHFGELWRGGLVGQVVRARLRRIPASTIPSADRVEWLFRVWAEVDAWVASSSAQLPR